jgi:hypothetical protein
MINPKTIILHQKVMDTAKVRVSQQADGLRDLGKSVMPK